MRTTYDLMFDYDDVIYPWSDAAHDVAVSAGITNGNVVTQWKMHLDYGCDEQELWDVLGEATLDGTLYNYLPIFGVLGQMARLRAYGHRIHIVTARGFGQHGDLIRGYTHDQIREWNLPMDSLHFSKDKAIREWDFAIDDGLHNYDDLDQRGIEVYLQDRPHNHIADYARRVHSVEEFADLVIQRASDSTTNRQETDQ